MSNKKFKAIAKPPSGKVMLKCLGKLNACCRMKGLDDNGMSKNSPEVDAVVYRRSAWRMFQTSALNVVIRRLMSRWILCQGAIPECKTVPDDASKEILLLCVQ